MLVATHKENDRITFSLPHSMNTALEKLKDEVKRPKSEIIKLAIENYLAQERKIKLQKAVEMMADEYENNDELTVFTSLDGDDFL